VNFYNWFEKREKLRYLWNSTTDIHKIWHDNACLKCAAHQKNNFKNPRWQTADALERPVLHHHEILQFLDFQDGGCPSSWNFEVEIFKSQ